MAVKTIGVIGAGQMGAGIAQTAAQSGYSVVLNDISQEYIGKGLTGIERGLDRLVAKEKITGEDRKAILGRIQGSPLLENLGQCDLVIEAIVENEETKRALFRRLDGIVKPEAIFASNTSSISITRLSSVTKRPDRFIGMHFMNPVPVMKLVEIIRGLPTSDATYETIRELAVSMGKTTVVAQDYPGFIVNRILMPMINEAVTALMEGVGSAQDIDAGMKLGANHPMGPLELADFIGLDTCLAIMETLHNGLGDDKYRPSPLLRKYVDAGYLGRKNGRGFHTYEGK
ncbi:MAG: 3-hydroxybutyryl-CoA dehydrogenase [Myxococcota bacterium]|nr:3-hydroxybutyryl-CoA dehydrogenase [Myxococcota bacterium]